MVDRSIPTVSGCHPDNIPPVSGLQTLQTDVTDRQTRKAKVAKTSSSLVSFCKTWNQWHEAGIVSKKIQDPEKPGKGLKAAWKKAQADAEQRSRFKNLDNLKDQLAAAKGFLFDAGWFDAVALIGGKNSDRRFYAEMLGNGAYSGGVSIENGDDWPLVQRIVRETYSPDVQNSSDVESKLTVEQFTAVKSVGLQAIAAANSFDKETPAAYRQARQAVSL